MQISARVSSIGLAGSVGELSDSTTIRPTQEVCEEESQLALFDTCAACGILNCS